jgi:hypothetical protein
MYNAITVVPAYGRDFKSKKEVTLAWNEQKDFLIQDFRLGGFVNNEQTQSLIENGITHLHFRYKMQRNVAVLDLVKNKWS